jgi:hypothetical protein
MPCLPHRSNAIFSVALALMAVASLASCRTSRRNEPIIEFSRVPPAGDGTPDKMETIEGRVRGALPGQRIVLFALSGTWWVQPLSDRPFTTIQRDSTWKSSTHPGAAYAALLVDASYHPPLSVDALPEKGGPVLAVYTVHGSAPGSAEKAIPFSGYQWEVLQQGEILQQGVEAGGSTNSYDARNAWIDNRGFLHLRVSRQGDQWLSAGVKLSRSLGYGSYRFVVDDVSRLEPASVFALYTFDYLGSSREMDIEISRWGEPEDKNAQYVVQPYVVPANTVRFDAPAGTLTSWINWEPGRVSFRTVRGSATVAEHVFTSGVPSPGSERIHMNLWTYNTRQHPLQHEFEVVIEKFEFLP